MYLIENKRRLDKGYHVYFVDFGNEEIVSIDRLSGCPESLRAIPWQSVQIQLANVKLTDDERHELLRDLEIARLEMKVIQKNQGVYVVDLLNNGKSIVEHILELQKKQPAEVTFISLEKIDFISLCRRQKHRSILNRFKNPLQTLLIAQAAVASSDNISKPLPVVEPKNNNEINDNLTVLISEQRRQNRLLEQVIAAINTTNALLTQLVQR